MSTTPPGSSTPPPYGASAPPPPPGPPPRPRWHFVRRERGHLLGGVATGIADAFNIDVMIVRVGWIIASIISGGLGVAAYIIIWVAFPSDTEPAPMAQLHGRDAGLIAAVALLGIGLAIALNHPMRAFGDVTWAIVLIVIGGLLLLRHDHHDPDQDPRDHGSYAHFPWSQPPYAPPFPTPPQTTPRPPDAPVDATSSPTDPSATSASTADHDASADASWSATSAPADPAAGSGGWATPDQSTPGHAMFVPTMPGPSAATPTTTAWTQHARWPAPPKPPKPPKPRSFLTPLTCSLLLIGGGIVTLLDNNGSAQITAAEIIAGGLCVIGLALVLSTWFGRARWLIPIGILLLIVMVPAATIDVPLTGGTGNHQYTPTTRAALLRKYEMGIGRLELNLREVPLAGRTTHIRAQIGIGELTIDVPSTVKVVVDAHVGAGSIRLFGNNDGGWPDKRTRTAPGTGKGELDLDLRVGAGDVQVRRFDATGAETIFPAAALPPAAPSIPGAPTP